MEMDFRSIAVGFMQDGASREQGGAGLQDYAGRGGVEGRSGQPTGRQSQRREGGK